MTGFMLAHKFKNKSVVKFLTGKFPELTDQVDKGKKEDNKYIQLFTQFSKTKRSKETQT